MTQLIGGIGTSDSGGSGGGGSAAPNDATYILKTPNGSLANAQALSALATGLLRVTTGTGAVASTPPGTGVLTALGVNVGSAGAFVTFNGVLGTPSSGTLTNASGLPISTGLTGAGTGVLTALGVNIGSAGAFVTFNGALGTPSSGTLTNATGLPLGGITGFGANVATALGVAIGSAGAPVLFNGAGGTPSSLALTNATGLPVGSITGFGTGVATFLATPSATNFAAALTGVTFPTSGVLQTTTGSPAGFIIASQAAGDILYASSSTAWVRLPKGSDTQVLTLASGVPSWAAPTGGAPTTATYITQVSESGLSAEQALSLLATGLMKVTTTTGVISSVTSSAGVAALINDVTGTGLLVFQTSPSFVTPALGAASAASLSTALITGTNMVIRAETSDGSDNGTTIICGGGGTGTTRGAEIRLYGNEGGNVGYILLNLGNVTNSNLRVVDAAGNAAMTINGTSDRADFAGTFFLNGLGAATTGTALVLASNEVRPLSSSIRFKENVQTVWDQKLASFMALQPIQFDYLGDGVKGAIGFSAEAAAASKVLGLVNLDPDGLPFSLRNEAFIAYQHLALQDHEARLAAAGL